MDKYEALKKYFGHDGFRPGQEEAVDALTGGRDVIAVMPTGAGKSVCFQLPALLSDGITLVISPLISLMQDQVMALCAAGLPAAYINSSLTPGQQRKALERAAAGQYRIIYVAPERLTTEAFLAFAQNAHITYVIADEAHCISQWGQDFRPSYLDIADFIDSLPVRPTVGAFTATATPQVRSDIIRLLRLDRPCSVSTGFDRKNLTFSVERPGDPDAALMKIIKRHKNDFGIVYCATRRTVEEVTERLTDAGYSATRYHAGLSETERAENQNDFRFGRKKIVVATNAFGMGIDKSDVRYVVHYNMPKDPESYYQEAGRAGRDGEASECVLLYSAKDVVLNRWLIEHGEDNPLVDEKTKTFLRERAEERLKQMTFYATTGRCLRAHILRYFGETAPDECGNCSNCLAFGIFDLKKKIEPLSKKPEKPDAEAGETPLIDRLRETRRLLSVQMRLPAYLIFSDASLADMAKKLPATEAEFKEVSGVGEYKAARYAKVFLPVIAGGKPVLPEPKAKKPKPVRENAGEAWSDEEDRRLEDEYEAGETMAAIARRHGRSAGAIRARLRRLGLID